MNSLQIEMAYGRAGYRLSLPGDGAHWKVINPVDHPALPDPAQELEKAFLNPIGSPPLRELIAPDDAVVIATSDNTRPVPNRALIAALVKHLGLAPERVTILVGTGSHQGNSREEWVEMFGEEIISSYTIVNHDAYDSDGLVEVGLTGAGGRALLNRRWVNAAKKIVLGFIEPHFFAGYSGGPKGVMPALAGLETILHFHRSDIIGHPESTWGVLAGNPQQSLAREVAALAPPDFLVNVTLNLSKKITGVWCGDYLQAHRAGTEQAQREAMVAVPHTFPLVVTSNSGYPLDQNLYQAVKGMSAAATIVAEGGVILALSECAKGIPEHGHFAELMEAGSDPQAVLERIESPGFAMLDQWQAQSLAIILGKARVHVFSSLADSMVRRCQLEPVENPEEFILQFCATYRQQNGEPPQVAILPQGPLTIPFVDRNRADL